MTALALSPAARRGIFTNLIEHGGAKQREEESAGYEEVVMYRCNGCDELYEWEDEAEACCKKDGEGADMLACPVCGFKTADAAVAVDCCLWKDLDAPTRWNLAGLIEAGVPMLEALERVIGQATDTKEQRA